MEARWLSHMKSNSSTIHRRFMALESRPFLDLLSRMWPLERVRKVKSAKGTSVKKKNDSWKQIFKWSYVKIYQSKKIIFQFSRNTRNQQKLLSSLVLLKKNPLTVSDGLGSGRKCNISLIFSKTTWAVRKKETELMIRLSELSVHVIQNFETLQ